MDKWSNIYYRNSREDINGRNPLMALQITNPRIQGPTDARYNIPDMTAPYRELANLGEAAQGLAIDLFTKGKDYEKLLKIEEAETLLKTQSYSTYQELKTKMNGSGLIDGKPFPEVYSQKYNKQVTLVEGVA
jgi:hypothetical protein